MVLTEQALSFPQKDKKAFKLEKWGQNTIKIVTFYIDFIIDNI